MRYTTLLIGITIAMCAVPAQAEAPHEGRIINLHGSSQFEAMRKAIVPYVA